MRRARSAALAATASLLTATAALLATPVLAADGASPISNSPRAAGRGGADLGVSDDSYAVATNPAGMSSLTAPRIDLGLAFYFAESSYSNERNDGHTSLAFPTPAPALGAVLPLGSPGGTDDAPEPPPFAIGLTLQPVAGGSGDAIFRTAVYTNGERERSDLSVMGLTAGLSWRIHPSFSIGLGITGLWAQLSQEGLAGGSGSSTQGLVRNFTNGQLDASNPSFLVNGSPVSWATVLSSVRAPDAYAASRAEIDGANGFGASGILGLMANPFDWLSIGASYRTPGWLTPLVGDAVVDARPVGASDGAALASIESSFLANHLPDGGSSLVSRYTARIRGLEMPQEAGAGFAFRPEPEALLAVDLKWINWSRALDVATIQLDRGNGADLAEIVSNGSTRSITSQVPYHWRDQVVVAVGMAVSPLEWLTVRAGYHFANDPVPRTTESPFTTATVEHHVTLGLGFQLGPVSLDAAWVHAFAKSTTIGNNVADAEFTGMRHEAEQDAVLIGGAFKF